MGCNAIIDVVWAKVKVTCFWVHPMWVSHGDLEAWGWTSTKEIVDIGCRVRTSHMSLCSGCPTRPFVHP